MMLHEMTDEIKKLLNAQISKEEESKAIDDIKFDKAPEPDGIFIKF